jgi:hypothetical protein
LVYATFFFFFIHLVSKHSVFLESRMILLSNEDVFVYTAQRRESLNAQEDRVEPCHLSSSLYYGGQDVYARSTTNQTYPPVKNDRRRSGEDDANGQNPQDVSRGNWWQGSLYY